MGTITDNMSLQVPTLDGDPGVWDNQINASFEILDSHTHQTGSGVPIETAALNINADLPFAGYAAINLGAASFGTRASHNTARSFWVRSSDGELMWRTNAGVNVQVTSGTGLNMSLIGGIAGDYAAAGASLYYDDANEVYRFLETAPLPNDWSRIACGDIDLYEHDSGIANRVRLRSPGSLAASYQVTLPAALPGAKRLLQLDSSGVMTAGGDTAIDGTLGVSSTASISGALSAGNTTITGTLSASSAVSALGGLSAGNNQHITVTGTGQFGHGDRTKVIGAYSAYPVDPDDWDNSFANRWTSLDAGELRYCPEVVAGEQVSVVRVQVFGNVGGTGDATVGVFVVNESTSTSIGSETLSNISAAWTEVVVVCTPTTFASDESLLIAVSLNEAGMRSANVRVTYSRPVS